MFAYILSPAVDLLCRRRIRPLGRRVQRVLATILVFVVFFFALGVSVRLIVTPLGNEIKEFFNPQEGFPSKVSSVLTGATNWYRANIPKDWQVIQPKDLTGLSATIGDFAKRVVGGSVALVSTIVDVVLIPVLAFYFVIDSRRLRRELIALVPPWRVREALRITREVGGILSNYVIGQLVLCLIAGIVTGVVLNLLNVPYVLVLAVFAGITRAIPIIGPVVSGVPICIIGAQQSTALGLWLLVFVTIMHFAESKFIMPILIGDRVRLHPAVILIVLLIGAELFGLMGMFLAAPVAAVIRQLLYRYVVQPRRHQAQAGRSVLEAVPAATERP
jgi:predicted PurR-regulated permease PerM